MANAQDEPKVPKVPKVKVEKPDSTHWLVRPDSIRKLWIGSSIVLALTVLSDLVVEHHPHFGVDGTFGFGAWFGFIGCVILVVGSKALGAILKQPDTYYDR